MDSDNFGQTSPIHSRSGTASGSTGMPDFRGSIKDQLQKTKDAMPQGKSFFLFTYYYSD